MGNARQLEIDFEKGLKILKKSLGDKIMDKQKIQRLNKIYDSCEKAWLQNLERLLDVEVKYLLIGEAAPWSETDEPARYFYRTFDKDKDGKPIAWIRGLWKVFCTSTPPKDINESLNVLAQNKFLLIDSLPFALKTDEYRLLKRMNKYDELVKECSKHLINKLNKVIKWSEEPKIAFAFKLNGKAVIKALDQKLSLPIIGDKPLDESMIAITEKNTRCPIPERLRKIWEL